jgi:hypothetical protein
MAVDRLLNAEALADLDGSVVTSDENTGEESVIE